MATEAYYEYQRDVPSVFGPIMLEPNTNGAFCPQGQIRCFAGEWAAVNYLQRQFSRQNYISIRTDRLDDRRGQRTGFQTLYSENSIMVGTLDRVDRSVSSELRFERSYRVPAYDLGRKQNQFTFAMDVIFRF